VEELVLGFVGARDNMLGWAKGLDNSEDGQERKKRRKIMARGAQVNRPERRSTRSSSNRDAYTGMQASQESEVGQELIAADSDSGSDYEEQKADHTSLPPSGDEPNDGLVACPICSKRMKEPTVFAHLDTCNDKPPSTSRPSQPIDEGNKSAITVKPTPLPTLAYSMLPESSLRKKLSSLGIPSSGPKILLQKRHTEWMNLWNANCDARSPSTKRELLAELDNWERTQGRAVLANMNGNGEAKGVMSKEFDRQQWQRGNKSDFDELVRRARGKRASATPKPSTPKEEQGGAEILAKQTSDQCPKPAAKRSGTQIFPSGFLRAGAAASLALSDSDLCTEVNSDQIIDLTTSSKPQMLNTMASLQQAKDSDHVSGISSQ
jgi:E3 ubiquitin-protein ligase RAD18